MKNKRNIVFFAIVLSLLLGLPLSAGAETKFSVYDLKPLGSVSIPSDWTAEIYSYQEGMVEYIFYDEYLSDRYRILRLLSVFIESGDFSTFSISNLDTDEIALALQENLISLFAIDADFKAAQVKIKDQEIMAITVPSEFFGGLSMPTILYLAYVQDDNLISITLIDEYVYMREDFELYDIILGDLLRIGDGSGTMKRIYDSINK